MSWGLRDGVGGDVEAFYVDDFFHKFTSPG
jgi:hypothetical protein